MAAAYQQRSATVPHPLLPMGGLPSPRPRRSPTWAVRQQQLPPVAPLAEAKGPRHPRPQPAARHAHPAAPGVAEEVGTLKQQQMQRQPRETDNSSCNSAGGGGSGGSSREAATVAAQQLQRPQAGTIALTCVCRAGSAPTATPLPATAAAAAAAGRAAAARPPSCKAKMGSRVS